MPGCKFPVPDASTEGQLSRECLDLSPKVETFQHCNASASTAVDHDVTVITCDGYRPALAYC